MPKSAQPPAEIAETIRVVRGQRVLLDADLAELYGVSTRRLNEQVRRNLQRFPADFLIDLTNHELAILKSHNATSSWGGRRKRPLAFTEQVAIMAATILDSPRAVQMSVYVVRAFARLRQAVAAHSKLAQELETLKHSVAVLDADTRCPESGAQVHYPTPVTIRDRLWNAVNDQARFRSSPSMDARSATGASGNGPSTD